MALQHGYEPSSTYGSYGAARYGGAGGYSTYGGYDTSLPSTAASGSSLVNGYDAASSGGGYNATMSSFSNTALTPMDEQQIYEKLADQSYKSRSDVLDHLRTVLRRSATSLPYNNPELVFDGLALALTDSTWDVRQAAIQVIRDALPKLGDKLIQCTNIVMPLLVNNIGDRKTTVRKGVTQALHCYLKQPKADASLCLNALINHGFNSNDPEVVREVVAIVPVLLTQEFAEMIDISRLMSELMRKLPAEGHPVKDRLEQLALTALEKVQSVVGEHKFGEAMGRCPRPLRRRYSVLRADGNFNGDADSDHEPDTISSRIPTAPAPAPAAISPRNSLKSDSFASNPVVSNNNNGLTYASVIASSSTMTSTNSHPSTPNSAQESKYFGIIPGDTYAKLMDDNPRARLEGADELKAIITRLQSGIALHSSLSDLLRFLSDFLDDANFKVVTTTLEIFLLLIKTAVDIRPHVGAVVDAVGRRMSDAKLLIRQGVSSVIIQLMRLVTAMPVLELISVYFRHKNSRMRQESINIAIAALLSFAKEDFDYEFLSNAIVPLLLDTKFQVRQAAMECVSVIAHLLGPDISVLMRALHKVEDSNPADGEGLASAVKVRAARHQLPRLNSDGLVEYSVALPGSASQRAMRPMPPGSDTSLILAAAGGHSAARPSQSVAVFTQGADDFTGPRTPLSGKARLPWQSTGQLPSHPSEQQAGATCTGKSCLANAMGTSCSSTTRVIETPKTPPPSPCLKANRENSVFSNLAEAVPFTKRSNQAFFEPDDVDDFVSPAANYNKNFKLGSNKQPENNNGGGYFKQYLESNNKRQLAHENSQNNNLRLNHQMPAHMSSSSEVLNAPRSDSPLVDVWSYDDADHVGPRRVPLPKNRNSQQLMRPSQLPMPGSQGSYVEKESQMMSKKGLLTNANGAVVAPRQLANSVAMELSARAALDQPGQLSPPEQLKQRGSASQRRAQRIFDRIENEDNGGMAIAPSVRGSQQSQNKSFNATSQNETEELSPKMPHRKVPALEKAFFVDFNDDKPLRPPPKIKTKPAKVGGSPPRQFENDQMYDEPPPVLQEPARRQARNSQTNGMAIMDLETFDQTLTNNHNSNDNNFPLHVRPGRPERKSLPGSHHPTNQKLHDNQNSGAANFAESAAAVAATAGDGKAPLSQHHSPPTQPKSNGFLTTQPLQLHVPPPPPNSNRSHIPILQQHSNHSVAAAGNPASDFGAVMEDDGFGKPRKQPPPIKQPALSLNALNNRGRGLDGVDLNESFNNSLNSNNGDEPFFSKSLPRPNRQRPPPRQENGEAAYEATVNGFKDANQPAEPAFPGNATYSYLTTMDGSSSGIGTGSPPNRNDSLMRSGNGFPSREDLSRQSTHSLVAEERLRSGDERMIEKYEEMKRRQKAFLRALSANFAQDVQAAEYSSSMGSTMSSGSLSAYDHNRQGTAPPSMYSNDGSGSAPPKFLARRPPKLKPVAPPAGYQPPARQTPRKTTAPSSGGAFTQFTMNTSLRAADLAYDLLPEPQNAGRALADATVALTNEDWEVKCEGLNLIRSVIKHQPAVITDSSSGNQLHSTNLAVITEMKNLRSQVARLAIQTMREMFEKMKRAMDIDAENIAKVLLGRSGDTNQFLRADSEQALTALALNLSPGKALSALLQNGLGHRNVSVRRSTCQHLLEVVERMGSAKALSGSPEVTGQLLPALLQFLMDGSPETRFYARKMCHFLLGHPDFDKMLQKFCAANQIANARDVVETVRTKGPGELTSIGSSQRLSDLSGLNSAISGLSTPLGSASSLAGTASIPSPVKPRQVAPMRRLDEATLDNVRNIIAQMSSNDWRERYDGITGLVRMTESSPEVTASQLTKLFDKFCPLLKDMNSKVNLFALQAFQSMLPMISNDIGPLIPLIMQHLTINLSSKSHEIQQAAAGAMHSMLAYVDPAVLLQPFANQTQTANSRNKAFMIDRLSEIVDSVCDRKLKQVTLHILPLLWHLLGSVTQSGAMPGGAGNVRQSTARLATVLHQHMGDDLLQHAGAASLPEKNYLLLQELIRGGQNGMGSASRNRIGVQIGEDLDQVVGAR